MEGIKKKLLEELISKLSGMDDPLMGDSEEDCKEEDEGSKGASVKVVKISGDMPEGLKKKLKLEA